MSLSTGFVDRDIGDSFVNTSLFAGKEPDMITMKCKEKRRHTSEAISVQFLGMLASGCKQLYI